MRICNEPKSLAKALRGSLAAKNIWLSHSECLEIVAQQFGFADWNALSAKLNKESGHLIRMDAEAALQPNMPDGASPTLRRVAPEPVACSFCAKPRQAVRSLIEGGCRNRAMSPCIFICDECVAFCAHINADAIGDATFGFGV